MIIKLNFNTNLIMKQSKLNIMQGESSNEKSFEIAQFVDIQIARICRCHYCENLINRYRIFCSNISNETIFQPQIRVTNWMQTTL